MDATSFNCFMDILHFLRFDKKASREQRRATDKLAPITDIWELFVAQLPKFYIPGTDITVDEQLLPFRGKCPFRQYIPTKPAKYGIKVWSACDSETSYPLKGEVTSEGNWIRTETSNSPNYGSIASYCQRIEVRDQYMTLLPFHTPKKYKPRLASSQTCSEWGIIIICINFCYCSSWVSRKWQLPVHPQSVQGQVAINPSIMRS